MNGRLQHRLAAALGLTAILLGSASCGDLVRQGKAASFLVIDVLSGASGAKPGEFGGTLASDVLTYVKKTVGGVEVEVPTVFEDLGHVELRILLKDQGAPGAEATPSAINAITVNRYHVSYRRADGRNVQGVDVPYAFDGAVTGTVSSSPAELNFTIVRFQAKEEAPLKALVANGGRIGIATIADVTFYGHDQAGNEVSQTGSISINFSDWGDPT
jgi:hypothetical protein